MPSELLRLPPMGIPEVVLLAGGTVLSLVVTWRSARNGQAHAAPRLIAFLAILLLLVWNVRSWFTDPAALHQLASWILLLYSGLLLVAGYTTLRAVGTPRDGFESTTTLVTHGIYRYVRHPLYGSLLSLAWGTFLKRPALVGAAIAVLASAALLATAKLEEKENLRRFGDAYTEYRKSTKMFVPYLL